MNFTMHRQLHLQLPVINHQFYSRPCVPIYNPFSCNNTRAQRQKRPTTTTATAPKQAFPCTAAPSRVLFAGGLPAQMDVETLQQHLLDVCVAAGCQPTRIEVMQFEDEDQKSRFSADWLHKGFALLAFSNDDSVQAASAAISAKVSSWGLTATVGPARKVPSNWPAELTYSPEELAALQAEQAALESRRAHNRRQRQRQSQRLIDSVDQILSGLSDPFGRAALQQYQPLLSQHAQQQLLTALSGGMAYRPRQAGPSSSSSSSSNGTGPVDGLQSAVASAVESSAGVTPQAAVLPSQLLSLIRPGPLQQLIIQQYQQQEQEQVSLGPIRLAPAASSTIAGIESKLILDWSGVPSVLDPAFGGQLADADVVRAGRGRMNQRTLRKRVQVESFALLLWQLTRHATHMHEKQLHVVEFGCGSGNLILPLAYMFPEFCFTAVDMKESAVQLLQQRVAQSGLGNVQVELGRIEEYTGAPDVVLALHACGSASDWSLAQAARCRAAFIVSPCCIGKINRHSRRASSTLQLQQLNDVIGNKVLQYPRSQQLQGLLSSLALQMQEQQLQDAPESRTLEAALSSGQPLLSAQSSGDLFSVLAATADYSHQDHHSHPDLAGLAKSNVELDRGMCMIEAGYTVALMRLLQPELTAKSDVLVGVPGTAAATQCLLNYNGKKTDWNLICDWESNKVE